MSEAKAFAAGYKAALDVLRAAKATEDAFPGCGNGQIAAQYIGLAIRRLEDGVEEVGARFESWQLMQDPDFRKSLAQMQRGEGVEVNLDSLLDRVRVIDPLSDLNYKPEQSD